MDDTNFEDKTIQGISKYAKILKANNLHVHLNYELIKHGNKLFTYRCNKVG